MPPPASDAALNAAIVAQAQPGVFYIELSEETPEPFNSDLLLWFADEGVAPVEAVAFRPTLPAVTEGRETGGETSRKPSEFDRQFATQLA